jgi:hypothetical protein
MHGVSIKETPVPLQNRKTARHIRCCVPTDLWYRLGRGEIVCSVRTSSDREAVRRSLPFERVIALRD